MPQIGLSGQGLLGTGAMAPASAGVAVQPQIQAQAAPFPEKPREATLGGRIRNAVPGLIGAGLGGYLGGPVGSALGSMLLEGAFNRTRGNPMGAGLLPGGGIASGLTGLFGGGNAQPFAGPVQRVNARDFNNPLGFGGSSNASEFVRSGSAPVGAAYFDSEGGRTVSLGRGMSERTNRFGVTTVTTPDGRSARKF